MGVYVILDGVRREYPEATSWVQLDKSGGAIEIIKHHEVCPHAYSRICQYGRYDLVGWMEDEK